MKNIAKKLITVLESGFIHRVQIAKNLLDREGIKSFVFDTHIDSIIGTAFIEGYKLKVNNLDAEKARAILQVLDRDE
ncbi:MAG: DUF2007 domain-containing protein [Lutibacter sp.]|jgi:hypothetical protein|nr:DUF2007 domain-containing protein [Lutibacter sp.]